MHFERSNSQRRLHIVILLSIGFIVAGCSRGSSTIADRQFVADMIPHHQIAMVLIEDGTRNSYDVELRRMVFEMSNYHHSELLQLLKWKSKWKVEPSVTFPGHLEDADLRSLQELEGDAHDIWWLSLMIKHHEGALTITRRAQQLAVDSAVREMATAIATVQRTQLGDMRTLLTDVCRGVSDISQYKGCGENLQD